MKGVFVRRPFARLLADGSKAAETRTRRTLDGLISETVAIIETGGRHPMIVGYMTIWGRTWVSAEEWDSARPYTLVPAGSRYDCTGKGKYLYWVDRQETCEPYPLPTDAVRHGRVWCEF